jgi:hypothetical protein
MPLARIVPDGQHAAVASTLFLFSSLLTDIYSLTFPTTVGVACHCTRCVCSPTCVLAHVTHADGCSLAQERLNVCKKYYIAGWFFLPWLWYVPPHPASHSRSHSPFFLRAPRGSGHCRCGACSHALPSFLQLLRLRIINFFWFLPYAIKESADPKLRKSEKRYTPYPITRHPRLSCPHKL